MSTARQHPDCQSQQSAAEPGQFVTHPAPPFINDCLGALSSCADGEKQLPVNAFAE
jgi:hypothetical protein